MELSKGSRRIFKQQQHIKPKCNSTTISKKCFLGKEKVIVLKMTKMSQHKNTEPCKNMPLILISLKKEQFC